MVAAPAKLHVVADYAARVVRGDIVAGRLVTLAAERHLRDLEQGHARGLRFDEAMADRAIAFFGWLRHSKGEWAGQPFELSPWQKFIVGNVFGWKRADGTRRFRTSYMELARKNGKTTMLAGIGLYLAFFDDEPGAEVYAAATKRDQAKICWGEAREMVRKTPQLQQRIQMFVANLHDERTRSKFEPLGADADSMDGLNISGAVVDELHAHKSRAVVDVLETATGSRRQPLINYITTAGYDRHSVCWSHHDYSVKVLERVVDDDTWFCYVAAIDAEDDWTDPRAWPKANPNLGISVKLDDLQRKCDRAKQIPSEQNTYKRLHDGIWTEQQDRWVSVELWDEGGGELDMDELAGKRCFGGLDLASTTDVAALELFFPDADGGGELLSFFWVPEDGIRKRADRDRVPYPVWVEQGFITATTGNIVDYDVIRAAIHDVADRFDLVELAYDRWNATHLITQLSSDGLVCVPFGMGFASMSAPAKEFEKLVLGGKLRHGGNPVLRWMVSNVATTQDPAGNIKPDRQKSTEKIDGVVAALMAIGRAMAHADTGFSKYEEEDLLFLDEEGE